MSPPAGLLVACRDIILTVSQGHIPELRQAVSSFTSALLSANPPINGLDDTIIIPARRLHLTLGVMSLTEVEEPSSSASAKDNVAGDEPPPPRQKQKTLKSALELLISLQPRATELLNGARLRVPLTALDIMKPERNDAARSHVCFVGPSEKDMRSEDGKKLRAVCGALTLSHRMDLYAI